MEWNLAFISYIFEAKGIQAYIVAGGRLRHMAGASALVDLLTTLDAPSRDEARAGAGWLKRALASAGFPEPPVFTRCAGGAFAFFTPDKPGAAAALTRFQDLWTLAVQRAAPGLACVDSAGAGATPAAAVADARGGMEGRRSFPHHRLPLATPLMLRAPRTGEPAVSANAKDDLDAGLLRKEAFVDNMRLARVFDPHSGWGDWPLDLETQFPFRGEDRTIAVLHADGNRMGEIVKAVGKKFASLPAAQYGAEMLRFSEAIRAAMTDAAQAARTELTRRDGERYPARPIILGGDDLTMILRGDIALSFSKAFLAAFETACKEHLATFTQGLAVPDLTACAGLVYIGDSQPFGQALELAESLCKAAKTRAKSGLRDSDTVPSCLAFHRVTGSQFGGWSDVLRDELTAGGRVLTMQPYQAAGEARAGLPQLAALKTLTGVFLDKAMAKGGVREIATLAYETAATAQRRWSRLLSVMEPNLRDKLREAYAAVAPKEAPFEKPFGAPNPLFDALTLAQIGRSPE